MKTHGLFFLLLMFVPLATQSATAWQSADYIQARLISAVDAAGDTKEIMSALDIRLSDGWHSYWRMPGEGGLPPEFDWNGSQNVEAVDVKWPAPERFYDFGLYSFGYQKNVLLPLTIKTKNSDEDVHLKLDTAIMVCKDICVPQNLSLELLVPAGEHAPSMNAARIQSAVKNLPYQENRPGLKIESMVIGPDALVVTTFSQRGYKQADLFVESGDLYITALPDIQTDEKDPRKAMIRISAPEGIDNLANALMDQDITLTLTDGDQSIERFFDF